jgi:hypothetical protein
MQGNLRRRMLPARRSGFSAQQQSGMPQPASQAPLPLALPSYLDTPLMQYTRTRLFSLLTLSEGQWRAMQGCTAAEQPASQ